MRAWGLLALAMSASLWMTWHWPPPQEPPPTTYPPVTAIIRHYFQPLGEVRVSQALRVARCESSFDPSAVGEQGELGLFQLHPKGVGERYIEAGWNLLDARENTIAAALEVAAHGWDAWACQP